MARTGVDVPTATARMGHSDVRLTLGYAQASDDLDAAAAEAIAAHLACGGRAVEGDDSLGHDSRGSGAREEN
jgi:hypothetical protein